MHFSMPTTQLMHVYHLLKAANAEVESDSLKSTTKVESNICVYWLINSACHWDSLEPLASFLVELCCFPSLSHVMLSMLSDKQREKLFVRDTRQKYTDRQT